MTDQLRTALAQVALIAQNNSSPSHVGLRDCGRIAYAALHPSPRPAVIPGEAVLAAMRRRQVMRRHGIEVAPGTYQESVLSLITDKFMKYDGDMEGADYDDFIKAEWTAGAMLQLLKEVAAIPGPFPDPRAP